jgi:hypothetical protein
MYTTEIDISLRLDEDISSTLYKHRGSMAV